MRTIDVLHCRLPFHQANKTSKINLVAALVSALFFVAFLSTVVYAEDAAYVPGEILVGVEEGITQDTIQAINAQLGGEIIYKFKIINAYQLRLPPELDVTAAIDLYKRQPGVKYAEPNYIVHADVIPNDPKFNNLWGLHNTGQTGGTPDADIDGPEAWDIRTDASAIIVADIDTGADYTHPDLAANIWTNAGEIPGNGIDDDSNGFIDDVHGYDFANNDGDPMDDNGHGTHTAGTIGAVGDNSIGVTGVAWKAQIMALKFLDSSGSGSTADAVKSLEYAKLMGAHLSSNSWGGGGKSISLWLAILKGPALFVAAAGNDGEDTDVNPQYPSSYRLWKIISVAATDHNDKKASFSNFGKKSVDLGAPGVSILSTVPGGSYAYYSGTSMATPHVAGVAALVWAEDPSLKGFQVKKKILMSVDTVPDLVGKTVTGGRLNAANALATTTVALAPNIATDEIKALSRVNLVGVNSVKVSELGNAYPSPANPEVWIPYRLSAAKDVTITIYNVFGQVVRTLQIGHRAAGIYENKQLAAHWDGRNANGEIVASGFYFYTLKAGDFTATRKLFIVR